MGTLPGRRRSQQSHPAEITLGRANRLCLESHFLIDPGDPRDVIEITRRICGLNAQTARGPYLSLWARTKGFAKEHLAGPLYDDRTLVKTWLMRATVHIVPADEYDIYQKALGQSLSEEWDKVLVRIGMALPPGQRNRLHSAILKAVSERPLTKSEVFPQVEHLLRGVAEKHRKTYVSRAFRELSYLGLVCHCNPTGPWYHFKENRYATIEAWLPRGRSRPPGEREARRSLLLKYLSAYGPASVEDFAYWTALKITQVRAVFEDAADLLAEVRIGGLGRAFWHPKQDVARLNPRGAEPKPPVRLLPEFDPLVMGHKDKSRIMDEPQRPRVFLRLADVAPTIVVDGRIAGTWGFKRADPEVSVAPFSGLAKGAAAGIRGEAGKLLEFVRS